MDEDAGDDNDSDDDDGDDEDYKEEDGDDKEESGSYNGGSSSDSWDSGVPSWRLTACSCWYAAVAVVSDAPPWKTLKRTLGMTASWQKKVHESADTNYL